jgi:hypothetical protein
MSQVKDQISEAFDEIHWVQLNPTLVHQLCHYAEVSASGELHGAAGGACIYDP